MATTAIIVKENLSVVKQTPDLTPAISPFLSLGALILPKKVIFSFFCPLLKISSDNPNLKIDTDLIEHFIVVAPMKKNQQIQLCPLSEHVEIWVLKSAHGRKDYKINNVY